MKLIIKPEFLDNVVMFNRREVQLRFLDKESYQKLYELAPEYFDTIEEVEWSKKSRRWSDIFEETPLFKIHKSNK